jgi:tripartite-type tricarboxylate transporter receptor subunit TctC
MNADRFRAPMMPASHAAGCLVAAGVLMVLAAAAGAQQSYPGKAIRFIVPSTPGANRDLTARLLGQKLTESWGQQVIVDNRPGGNTLVGSEALAKSTPDGYTLMLLDISHLINALVVPNYPYNALKVFAPVATLNNSPYVLAISPSLPVNDLKEFIAHAKTRPGQLNYGTSGVASAAHLTAEIMTGVVGIRMQHIAYKGGGQVLNDLVGGQVQMYLATAISVVPFLTTGRIKALAVAAEARLEALPKVPTFAEAGVPSFNVKNWNGLVAPLGTPKAIIDKLSGEIAAILAKPDVRDKLASLGGEPLVSTPAQFSALMQVDQARYAKILATITLEK